MKFWNRRRKTAPPRTSTLALEKLENRELFSVNTITFHGGETVRFVDADGSRVNVRLVGPGTGTIDLTNGQLTGGYIDNLTLQGTTARSHLSITAKGGTVAGTKINELVIEKALNELGALNRLVAPKVDFVAGGLFTADGNIGNINIRDVGADAEIAIAGDVRRITTRSMKVDASLDVSGRLQSLILDNTRAGVEISAAVLDLLKVRSVQGTNFDIGAGGLGKAKVENLRDSAIASEGDIGKIIVQGNMIGTSIACNINSGSDGVFGSVDDYITDPNAPGNINTIRVKGRVGSVPGQTVTFVASGNIDNMNLGARNRHVAPNVCEQAASSNVPLAFDWSAIANTFGSGEIWVAIYGEEIIPGGTSGPTYFLDPTTISGGQAHITATSTLPSPSASTPNLLTLSSATLATWGNALNLHAPLTDGNEFSGRILISVGTPVQAQVNTDGTVSAPSASDLTDPSTGTFYDFLEFTVRNHGGTINLDVDTSQVDAFGLPIGLEFFQDWAGTEQFSVGFTGTATSGSPWITNISAAQLQTLSLHEVVSGANIPAQTRIIEIDSVNNQIKLNNNALPGSNSSFLAYTGGPVGVNGLRDLILLNDVAHLPTSTDLTLLKFITDKISGNVQARPFLQTAAPFETFGPVPITFATNANPIIISTNSVAGLNVGDMVTISGVLGNTNANGTHAIGSINTTANTFELTGVAGNGAYTSGGTWSMAITGATNSGPIVITTSNTLGMKNGDIVEVSGVEGNTAANGFFFVSGVMPGGTTFTLDGSTGNGAYTTGGTWKIFSPANRLVSPKDVVEGLKNPQDANGLNNFYNEMVDDFFLYYYQGAGGGGNQFSIVSAVNGFTYTGYVEQVNIDYSVGTTDYTYDGFALHLTSTGDPGNDYYIIYPFFTTNAPSPDIYEPKLTMPTTMTVPEPPSWIVAAGQQNESASQMIFGCDAVFADNVARGLTGVPSTVQGDLEDSISAAFNRGIALLDPSDWGVTSNWYPPTGTYNYWVEYWHQTGLTYGDLAYAFPFDDKFGASTNLNEDSVGLAKITLGAWTATTVPSTTTLVSPPTTAQLQGPISLTAQVAASNTVAHPLTGTVSFFINGVAINTNDYSSSPPVQPVDVNGGTGQAAIAATLPVMPDGNTPHTYVVTAVYSGDDYRAPSVAYSTLELTPAFSLGFGANPVQLGQAFDLDVTLNTPTYSGTIEFSISYPDGSGSISLGTATPSSALTTKSVTIPTTFLQFTGDIVTSSGSSSIQNVSDFSGLAPGQIVTGTGLPNNLTLGGPTPNQFTIQPASSVTGNVMLTVNGRRFAAYILPSNPTIVQNVDVISDLHITDVVSGVGIAPGTSITGFTAGSIPLNQVVTAQTGVNFTSNGVNAAFPITVTYKPTDGASISTTANIGIQA